MIQGIHYYSLLGGTGYGEAALDYIDGLLEHDIPVRWSPLSWTEMGLAPWRLLPESMRPDLLTQTGDDHHRPREYHELIDCSADYDTVVIHCMPELWPKLVEADKLNIGSTVWETDKLPSHWPQLVRCVDHVFVPCEFNRPLFALDDGPPVSVIPHVARLSRSSNDHRKVTALRESLKIPKGHYVFYSINTWSPRKALWDLLHAYLLAFNKQDPVTLVLKTDENGVDPARRVLSRSVQEMAEEIISNYPGPANVVMWTGHVPDESITLLHETGDCYISLTHSEGWGLGAIDAAAAGKPVIMTGWGGQLDFLPDDCAYLVQYKLVPIEVFQNWESYQSDQNWANADLDDAIRWQRHVFNNRKEAALKGKQLKEFVELHFNSKAVTDRFVEAIHAAHSQ